MRIARGLPPLAPRKLFNGSKTEARRGAPSTIPNPPNGYASIIITNARGNHLGFVSKHFNDLGSYSVTTDCTAALSDPQLTASHGLINSANPGGFSAVGLVTSLNFTPGVPHGLVLSGTAATPYGSLPLSSIEHSGGNGADQPGASETLSNTSLLIESNIWSIGANNELSVTWVNPDGSQGHLVFIYFPSAEATIVTTLDLDKYRTVETAEIDQILSNSDFVG
ncbi:hypothetical protein FRB90_012555 [Tulasnella sp. 427]|nr:hypothetical protein FRB90_012555 [Tulasnella sp. 427]